MEDHKVQFTWLADYVNEISCKNLGSIALVTIKTDDLQKPEFVRICICLGQLKQDLLEGCRVVLLIDGCFIKEPWKGQILIAIG